METKEKILNAIREWNNSLSKTERMNLNTKTTGGICAYDLKKKPSSMFVPNSYSDLMDVNWRNWSPICPDCLDNHLEKLCKQKGIEDNYKLINEDIESLKSNLKKITDLVQKMTSTVSRGGRPPKKTEE